jgi:hypothetical protein
MEPMAESKKTQTMKPVSKNNAGGGRSGPPLSYVLSVSLEKGRYRHIRISAYATLLDLHTAILDAFAFEDDHAHAFFMDNVIWSEAKGYYSEDIEDEPRHTKDFALVDFGLKPGALFKYVFDFGEEWAFQIKLMHKLNEPTDPAYVVHSAGKAPLQYDDTAGDGQDDLPDKEDEELDFPETYSPKKLQTMYVALALPITVVSLLQKYFDAFSNFYEILSLQKALEIYNRQNPPLSEKQFADFSDIARHEEHDYVVMGQSELFSDVEGPETPMDREIINGSLLMYEEDYEEVADAQEGKPYFYPLQGGASALCKRQLLRRKRLVHRPAGLSSKGNEPLPGESAGFGGRFTAAGQHGRYRDGPRL